MRVLTVRNVHSGFPIALEYMEDVGIRRSSRNGDVFLAPLPVTTVYEKPCERVMFWPQRDANPFFHLYEALWMLAGRNDVAPLERYVKKSIDYSDDGTTLHGAYGYRWRNWFRRDQLTMIAEDLKKNPDSRRNILQMWDCTEDLGRQGKDLPCNTIATFQRGFSGELNLTVFCRSNDIIWGCYGANAVQFSMLLEYMALWIGCPVGTYSQVSVNWHAYDTDAWKNVISVRPDRANFVDDPYLDDRVHIIPMSGSVEQIDNGFPYTVGDVKDIDNRIYRLLRKADTGNWGLVIPYDPWERMIYYVLFSHYLYKENKNERKYTMSLELLNDADQKADWVVAAREWIERRYQTYLAKEITDGSQK